LANGSPPALNKSVWVSDRTSGFSSSIRSCQVCSSNLRDASVGEQLNAVHIAAIIRSKEKRCVGNLIGCGNAARGAAAAAFQAREIGW
jgi:hypothetical protein